MIIRFNLTLVECKCRASPGLLWSSGGFNLTLVECKLS